MSTALSTVRHDSIFNPRKYNPQITLVGCGAIGSRIFSSLIELGLTKITCIDDDTVAPHNLANQAFVHRHIDQKKVAGLLDIYREKMGAEPPMSMHFHPHRLPHDVHEALGVVFLCVDSFAARREIVESFAKQSSHPAWIIDTRMASSHGNIVGFAPHQIPLYLATLGDDALAETSACGASISVGPTAAIIANLAVWHLINLLTNPEALDTTLDIHLKPFVSTTGALK